MKLTDLNPSEVKPIEMPLSTASPGDLKLSDIDQDEVSTPYGSLGQQAITGLEGAASSATFGASTGIEKALHLASDKDIQGRREENPIAHGIGQVAGLAVPAAVDALTGGAATPEIAAGEAAAEAAMNPLSAQSVMSGIGDKVAKATGLGGEGAGATSQIAHQAVKGAVETAIFQGGDEISKMLSNDPNQSIGTAAANVGLAGLLGAGVSGGLGGVSQAWRSAFESKVGELIADFKNRIGEHLGLSSEIAPEAEAAIPEEALSKETRGIQPGRVFQDRDSGKLWKFSEGPIKNFPPRPGTPLFEDVPETRLETLPDRPEGSPLYREVKNEPTPPPASKEATIQPEAPTEVSLGTKLADILIERGVLKKLTAEGLGAAIGAGMGRMTGVGGGLGALIGEHALGPFFNSILPALVKPILSADNSPAGLKSALNYGMNVIKGDSLITKAAQSIFKPGMEVASSALADRDSTDKLDKRLTEIQGAPQLLTEVGGHVGHYLPDHQIALSSTVANAVNYLHAEKPKPIKPAPLDPEIEPTAIQKAAYQRTLGIAQDPLLVLQHAKQGTLLPKDLKDLNALYPSLHAKLAHHVTDEMTNHVAQGGRIPYETKMGLSLFLGVPLDSTLSPSSIQSVQMIFANAKTQGPQQGKAERAQRNTAPLGKASEVYLTPLQARQASRSSRD